MTPTLYILMRDDLDSLNPGKAIAQGSHATDDFEWACNHELEEPFLEAVKEWREDRTFGRCLCVAAKPHQIEEIVDIAEDSRFPAGTVVDPTYPVSDGEVIHALELLTCGWVFTWEDGDDMTGPDWKVRSRLKKLALYK